MNSTLDELRQHQLVILRRLRNSPLTEFELTSEIAEHSGYTVEQATDKLTDWLEELQQDGLVWTGTLSSKRGQQTTAAALTSRGRGIVK
ncbi:MAG: hypothetical protein ACYTFA_17850 [Planctomycetota bacterium]